MKFYDVVVVGAGMAAMAAVKTFRAGDSGSSILLISDQPDVPVRKPPLSKQLWSGQLTTADIVYNPAKFNVVFQPKTTVQKVDFGRKLVTLSSGDKVRYNRLVIATGLTPVKINGDASRLVHLNTLADYRALKARVGTAGSIVVIGGGLLGVEIASAFAQNGWRNDLIFPAKWPLDHFVPQSIGVRVMDALHRHGVKCHAETRAQEVTSDGRVRVQAGESIYGDLIVPLIGQRPSLDFLDDTLLDETGGVHVDRQLHAFGLDDVFACGDIISVTGSRERCPHEDNAVRSGAHVGQVLLGSNAAFTPSTFVYSEFLGMRLESIGVGRARDCEVGAEEWNEEKNNGIALMTRHNFIERVTLINHEIDTSRVDELSKRVIGKRCPPKSSELLRFVKKFTA